jgi:hypothetical protein
MVWPRVVALRNSGYCACLNGIVAVADSALKQPLCYFCVGV